MSRWRDKAQTVFDTDTDGIQNLWDNINKGQQKQLIKIQSVKETLDRHKVGYGNAAGEGE